MRVSLQRHWRHGLAEVTSQFWEVLASECQLQWCSLCFTSGWQGWNKVRTIPLSFLLQNGTSLYAFRQEFSIKTVPGSQTDGYHNIGTRNYFSSVVFLSLLLWQNKKLWFFSKGSFTGSRCVPDAGIFGKVPCCLSSWCLENFSSGCCIPWVNNP